MRTARRAEQSRGGEGRREGRVGRRREEGKGQTHHDLEPNPRQLLLRRQPEPGPVVGRDLLVVLDHLLWVAAVEDELHDGLFVERPRLVLARELDEGVVDTKYSPLDKVYRGGEGREGGKEGDVQVRAPGGLPVVRGEDDFVLRVDDEVLVVPHDVRDPNPTHSHQHPSSSLQRTERDGTHKETMDIGTTPDEPMR